MKEKSNSKKRRFQRKGVKRLNITVDIKDYEMLKDVSEYNGISPTTQAASYAVRSAREDFNRFNVTKKKHIPY